MTVEVFILIFVVVGFVFTAIMFGVLMGQLEDILAHVTRTTK